MGRCVRCGQPTPGDIQGQLCTKCKNADARAAAAKANKVIYAPAKFYCKGCGKLLNELSSSRISVGPNDKPDSDGFYHVYDSYCSECAVSTAKKHAKRGGRFIKFLLIILIIGGIVYGGGKAFNKLVLGGSKITEKAFEKRLTAAESDSRLLEDVTDDKAPGESIAGFVLDAFIKNDYHMYLYTDAGKIEVQKYTTLGSPEYYFLFDKDCGVFGGKMFVETADALYETGDANIIYTLGGDEYNEIHGILEQYLPENACVQGSFNKQNTIKDDNDLIDILYGDDSTVYVDWYDEKYYEKKSDTFIYITFSAPGEGTITMHKPADGDCEQVD